MSSSNNQLSLIIINPYRISRVMSNLLRQSPDVASRYVGDAHAVQELDEQATQFSSHTEISTLPSN